MERLLTRSCLRTTTVYHKLHADVCTGNLKFEFEKNPEQCTGCRMRRMGRM